MNNNDIKDLVVDIMDFPQKGISFKDISGILANSQAMKYITKEFAKLAKDADVIVGPDARGFLFGVPLAMELDKPFVMARKPGKLPGEITSLKYDLEYGTNTLEIQKNSIKPGQKVVIVDDLLATGGTAKVLVDLVKGQGATVLKSLFVIELEFLQKTHDVKNVISLVKYK